LQARPAPGAINNLFGGDANDSITGGGSSDTLDGGAGRDTLAGGLGDDRYLVNLVNPTPATAALDDSVTDSGGIDTLVVSAGTDAGRSGRVHVIARELRIDREPGPARASRARPSTPWATR